MVAGAPYMPATAYNKRVPPTPRVARLRKTPAQTLWSLRAMLGRAGQSRLVGRADAPASQLLNVS